MAISYLPCNRDTTAYSFAIKKNGMIKVHPEITGYSKFYIKCKVIYITQMTSHFILY